MLKIAFLLLLVVASVHADDPIQPTIRSGEQAIIRFREARDIELKDFLPKDQLELVAGMNSTEGLTTRHYKPSDYGASPSVPKPGEPQGQNVLGTMTNVIECKHDTWVLYYSSGYGGYLLVYLDAVTGKVLHIHYNFVCG